MKLLFVTPPMGNWAPWGERHLASNPLYAQVTAFIREKKAASVEVLDCRALGLNDNQMMEEIGRRKPDAVFFGTVIAAAGGAAPLARFHNAMKLIKHSLEEMELLNKQFGVKYVTFMDDDFNSDRQKMVDLVQELEKKKLDLAWFILGRAQNFIRDADIIPRLRNVRMYQVLIGVDGGTDEEIAEARKGPMKVGVKQLKEIVGYLRQNDISTIATYLNGFWEDDEVKIRRRYQAVDVIDPDLVMIQALNPIPGSPIWKRAIKENVVEIKELGLWDLEHAVMPTKFLTRQQVGELTSWAFQSFYNKPGRVERILNGYTSPYVRMKFLSHRSNADKLEKAAVENAQAI
ncbi:MAG: hypothetical protein HYY46_01095 [Deltaproteobacteria bacterium]|nr:hypothetical protein [Deltaproteobacteria bacterium]